MNCTDMRNRALLAEAGALPARQRGELDRHLAACPACREFVLGLRAVTAHALAALPDRGPSERVMAAIRDAAEQRVAHHRLAFFLPRPVAQAMAYAAVFAVVATGAMLLWPNGKSKPIEQIHTLIAMVSEASSSAESENAVAVSETAVPAQATQATDETKLRGLAEQLLRMEGLAVDDSGGEEPVTEAEAPSPTALQFRSTCGFPAQTRV